MAKTQARTFARKPSQNEMAKFRFDLVMMARLWLSTGMQTPDELRELAWVRRALSSGEAQEIRETSCLTTGDVATAVAVTPVTVWRWEKKLRTPRGAVALRYARLLRSLRSSTSEKAA